MLKYNISFEHHSPAIAVITIGDVIAKSAPIAVARACKELDLLVRDPHEWDFVDVRDVAQQFPG